MTGAVLVEVAYAVTLTGVLAGALAEAVAVSAAVLVDQSIGHLVRCGYFSVYLLVRFCVHMQAYMWVFC